MGITVLSQSGKKYIATELATALAALAILVYCMRSMLIFGETTLTHDNYYWYPVFHFFAENIALGQFPMWNPFTHGGEPFYPLLFQLKLLEPVSILVIYLGHFFTGDIVMLFNWNRVIQSVLLSVGVYIILRPIAANTLIRAALIPILLLSSFMLGSFRQDGIINQFTWTPYIMFFLMRIIYYRRYNWHNWLAMSALTGLNFQSYFFSGIFIFLLFFFAGLAIFRRELLSDLVRSNGFVPKIAACLIILLVMLMPNIILLLEKDNYVFPLRMIAPSTVENGNVPATGGVQHYEGGKSHVVPAIKMDYALITHTGAFSNIWDFIQTISPEGNDFVRFPERGRWGSPSESYIYIGMLPWVIAVLGMIAGVHGFKKVWMTMMAGFGLLLLGPYGGVHQVLHYIYPPMWFVRNTHALVLFFEFTLMYFFVLGCNHIYLTWETGIFKRRPDCPGQSILSYLPVNAHYHFIIAFALFFTAFMATVLQLIHYLGREPAYSFPVILLMIIIGWVLRGDLGRKGLFIGLLLGQICSVLLFTRNADYFVMYLCIALAFPGALFLLAGKITFRFNHWRKPVLSIITAIIIFTVFGDLVYSLNQSAFLYASEKHPAAALDIDTTVHSPEIARERLAAPAQYMANTSQSVRYLSILYHRPYVFSPLMEEMKFITGDADEFSSALISKKWNSFSLPKSYFELVHSGIPAAAMKEMFAVGKDIFQFKSGVIELPDADIASFLNSLGTDQALRLLDNYLFVDRIDMGSSLKGFSRFADSFIDDESILKKTDHGEEGLQILYIDKYNYNSLNMEVSAAKDGILYWSDTYDEKWQAYINGRKSRIFRANTNFKALILPEGKSRVSFRYEHYLFKAALFAFFATLFICITIALISLSGSGELYLRNQSRK